MGVVFVEHMNGSRLYSCLHCYTNLSNRSQLISTRFTGGSGRAFLFRKVVNVKFSKAMDRIMLTGRHIVRDVSCKNCNSKLGWMYEYAHEKSQEYKEGKVILERALITETNGIDEYVCFDN
ncbi:protein yippee-like 5 [Copidosoma floridanum]|uniref:protein yippee-like 5 n=1 Tax=Copidosoma floridanum TaxID=29053 RepID=UPI0006C97AC9|nr:protein yippee-like 5 [Copidosoma floridanum]